MAVSVCRAKNPTSCRVHGNGGRYEELQGIADEAAVVGDITLYMSTRAEMEGLSDDEPETFIAPDTGNLIAENWMDNNGEIMSEAPNDMLLSNLAQSSVNPMPYTERIKEILRGRGYSEEDLFIAKHFHFKKDETGWQHSREVTKMEVTRAGMEIENKHGVQIDPHDRDQVIERYFYFVTYDMTTHKERCKQFVEGYENYVQSFK